MEAKVADPRTWEARIAKIADEDTRHTAERALKMLPKRLRKIRKSADMTLKEVANETGVTWQAISQMERGVGTGSVLNICILAVYYGVSVDWLLGDEW